MAWNASSSLSKTLAGPLCEVLEAPVIFSTAPSGARLPRIMAKPPFFLTGLAGVWTTS